MEDWLSASRLHVRSAIIRCPAVASLGIRAMHASKESPCVPCDTRLGPVVSTPELPLDAAGAVDPLPAVEPPFISAQPRAKVANPMVVHRNS